MKLITPRLDQVLSCDFNGKTYKFPSLGIIEVEDDLYEHLKEIWPLSFNYEPEVGTKDPTVKPEIKDTVNMFGGANFGIKSANISKDTGDIKNGADKDGVEWYGAGLEDDQP